MITFEHDVNEVEIEIDREFMRKWCKYKYEGSFTKFANDMGIENSHLHKFITRGIGGGKVVWSKLYYYCRQKNISFTQFLRLEEKI